MLAKNHPCLASLGAMALTLTAACEPSGRRSSPAPSATSAAVAPATSASASAVAPPSATPTTSLAVYTAAGVPAHGRRWEGPDYIAAAGALDQLAQDGVPLPSKGDPTTGPLFARMISPNLASLDAGPSVEEPARLKKAAALLEGINGVIHVYASALLEGKASLDDFIELSATSLRATPAAFAVVSTFTENQPPGVDGDQLRKGLAQMQQGLAKQYSGLLQLLGAAPNEPGAPTEAQRTRIAEIMVEVAGTTNRWITPEQRKELAGLLETLLQMPLLKAHEASLKRAQEVFEPAE